MRIRAVLLIAIIAISSIILPLSLFSEIDGYSITSNNDNRLSSEVYHIELYNNQNKTYESSAFNEALLSYTTSNSMKVVNNTLKGMCDEDQVTLRIESDSIQQSTLSIQLSLITLDENGNTIHNSADNPDNVSITLFYGTDNQQSLEPSSGNGISNVFLKSGLLLRLK